MSGNWKEVVRLSFKGERFRDHALDLTALAELGHFQKLIADTAKALWRAANPNRERLPAHFDERTRLCLRSIEDGSATTPLEAYVDDSPAPELFDREPFEDLTRAVDVAYRVYSAADSDAELPDEFPQELVADYAKWGESLADDEAIEICSTVQCHRIRVTKATRERLATRLDTPYEDSVDLSGEVVEADVGQQRFNFCTADGQRVTVKFTPEQEMKVTTALRDHRQVDLHVRGRGEFLPGGRLQRIVHVAELEIVARGTFDFDNSARSIEDELSEIAAEVPTEEWKTLPADLTDHIDHYLYGTPKE